MLRLLKPTFWIFQVTPLTFTFRKPHCLILLSCFHPHACWTQNKLYAVTMWFCWGADLWGQLKHLLQTDSILIIRVLLWFLVKTHGSAVLVADGTVWCCSSHLHFLGIKMFGVRLQPNLSPYVRHHPPTTQTPTKWLCKECGWTKTIIRKKHVFCSLQVCSHSVLPGVCSAGPALHYYECTTCSLHCGKTH